MSSEYCRETIARAVDPLREAGQAVLRKWRHMAPVQLADYHVERCDCLPCQMGKLEAALAAAPQPAPVDRVVMERLLADLIKDRGYGVWDDTTFTEDVRMFADALIAAGWRKP